MIEIGHHPAWKLGPLSFHADTIISMLIVSAFLVALALIVKYFVLSKPGSKAVSKFQAAIEMLYEFAGGLPVEVMGEHGRFCIPLVVTFFLFILCSNLFGLIPVNALYGVFFERSLGPIFELTAPTADLNTTAGLALIVFMSLHYYGFSQKGPAYLKRFFSPNFLFFPLNVMEELAKPLSLAIRLFGNTFGKETIILILVSLTVFPLIYPIPILALGVFIAFIQAYIFALLTTFYLAAALSGGH